MSFCLISRYDKLTKPSFVGGSTFAVFATGATATGLLEGGALYAVILSTSYKVY